MQGRYKEVSHLYAPTVTPYIESQLARVGRVRVSEMLRRGVHMKNSIVETKKVSISHFIDDEMLWMQGSVNFIGDIMDVHRYLLNQSGNPGRSQRELVSVRDLFGKSFIDGINLLSYQLEGVHERMSINWMALQPPHSSYSDRDYVYLHYGNVYTRLPGKKISPLHQQRPDRQQDLVACHIWESIDLDGCESLKHLDLSRQRLTSWGFLVEPIDNHGTIRVSFTLTQPQGTTAHRGWMEKLLVSLSQLESILYDQFDTGPCCNSCMKTFSVLRRRIQCKYCKYSFCSKCISTKDDLIVCHACRRFHTDSNVSKPTTLYRSNSVQLTKSISRDSIADSRCTSSSTSSDLENSMIKIHIYDNSSPRKRIPSGPSQRNV